MAGTNKYEPLGRVLSNSNRERVSLTFDELNRLCSLPQTAYVERPFWANTWQSRRAQTWLQVGYVVDEICLGSYIVFRRDPMRAKDPGAGRKNSASVPESSYHDGICPYTHSKNQISVPRPCPTEVEKYIQSWNELENYPAQEAALNDLFFRHCPENKTLSDILLKVAALNTFYSTNIFSVAPVAQHILDLNIDPRLSAGDLTLVGDIQRIELHGKEKNFYSFASKYCSHHAPDIFPIYDSYVGKMLCYFRDMDGFFGFRENELKDYSFFKGILTRFQVTYGLTDYSIKSVDKYLWQVGKKYFPNQYGKQK